MLDYKQLTQQAAKWRRKEELKQLAKSMTPAQQRLIMSSYQKISSKSQSDFANFLPHTPTEKQQRFLNCGVFEALYGGAAGGGKSDALLHGAIAMAARGGAALVIRRTYADLNLPGAVMDRAHAWLSGTSASWHAQDKRWSFPGGGSVQFGYMETDKDRYRYQGAEFQGVYVDELTQMTEAQYTYLISRVRRKINSTLALEVRCASNPGGVGHDWVKRRFIDNAEGRVFIPASLTDNPHIDQVAYKTSLELLDSVTRKQLLEGLWVRDDGGQLYQYSHNRNLVEQLPRLDSSWRYVLGVDLGASARNPTTAFCVVAYSYHEPNVLYFCEAHAFASISPTQTAEHMQRMHKQYDFETIVCDAGALGAGYVEEFTKRYGLPVRPARKQDKLGARKLINAEFERGTIKLSRHGCETLANELEMLCWDDKGLDANPAQEDHLTDAMLYAWREARYYLGEVVMPLPEDPIARAEQLEQKRIEKVISDSIAQNRKRASRRSSNSFFSE